MNDMGASSSVLEVSERKSDSFYPIWFGVSCAFTALRVLSKPGKDGERWSEFCSQMLQGSAQLLGLLVWRVQRNYATGGESELRRKLESAEKAIDVLKEMRQEDAKANEKAAGLFASQEKKWLFERKKLQQHIVVIRKELKVLEKNKEEAVLGLNGKLKEMEVLIGSKDKALDEEKCKSEALEDKLMKAETTSAELRETAKLEAHEHSADLRKHKTAFLELASHQRKLEADLGRALKQLEAKRQELDLAIEQKEESVMLARKLSFEVVKLHKDLEQKDKLLSVTQRKSKLDITEKQMLSKEVKISKIKKKQAKPEQERGKVVKSKGSKCERRSLREMLACNSSSDDPSITGNTLNASPTTDYALACGSPNIHVDSEIFSPVYERCSTEENDGLGAITTVIQQLEERFRIEAEKYAVAILKRHQQETDAFAELLRHKDEKLEALCEQLLNMEVESKREKSFVEGLNQEISHLQNENMKLEDLLSQREEEVKELQEQLVLQIKPRVCKCHKISPKSRDANMVKKHSIDLIDPNNRPTNPNAIQSPADKHEEEINLPDEDCVEEERVSPANTDTVEKLASPIKPLAKDSILRPWNMDLHALGVSYKIKRLKQQLVLLERLTGTQESSEEAENSGTVLNEIKGFTALIFLLNKQVSRYQSLQDQTDELCKRMHENKETKSRDSSTTRTKQETKTLEHFLEETFQLQRHMVATGQRSIEVQAKIETGFSGLSERFDQSVNFDAKKFTDNMKSLFQEVQRGIGVTIARIIGDLEGTILAREGMLHRI